MQAATYIEARKNLARIMDRVCDDHDPIIITRYNARPVVMVSLEDYNAIQETVYLTRSPKNAARLSKAMQDLKNR